MTTSSSDATGPNLAEGEDWSDDDQRTGRRRRRRPRFLVLLMVLVAGCGGGTTTVQKDPTPTPAERLPVTPPPPTFDTDKPGGLPARAEPPARVDARQQDQVDSGTYDTSGVLDGAAAQPAHKVCYTAMNGGPRSVKNIGLGVAHVTVSLNVTGLRDGDALCAFFRRVQASPTWTVDNEANSWENVPLDRVPWTQAWYNRPACAIEYVGSTGRPGQGPAQWTDVQLQEGGRLFAKCFKLAGIPVRSGRINPATGSILVTGLITHQELGAKGGGHTDPGPFWSRQRQLYWIGFYARGGTRAPLTTDQQHACDVLNFHRRRAHVVGRWYPRRVGDALRWKKLIPAGRCPSKYRR